MSGTFDFIARWSWSGHADVVSTRCVSWTFDVILLPGRQV